MPLLRPSWLTKYGRQKAVLDVQYAGAHIFRVLYPYDALDPGCKFCRRSIMIINHCWKRPEESINGGSTSANATCAEQSDAVQHVSMVAI